jgi:hypothetical protein
MSSSTSTDTAEVNIVYFILDSVAEQSAIRVSKSTPISILERDILSQAFIPQAVYDSYLVRGPATTPVALSHRSPL